MPMATSADGHGRAGSSHVAVILLLFAAVRPVHALIVVALLAVQLVMMRKFLKAPIDKALWYSGFGVPVYVSGMMVSAFAVRALAIGG